jgi:glycosyltransferase involved in cell wall biosynthesis
MTGMHKIAFVVSGKSPTTIPGGLGAYSYNVAKILDQLGFKTFIIGFSSREEVVPLAFATLIHFKNPYASLLGLGSFLAARLFAKKMAEVMDRETPSEIVVYSAGIWGIAGSVLKKNMARNGIAVKTLVGYFTTHSHEYHGHVIGAPARDYGLLTSLLIRALSLFARGFYSPLEGRMLRDADIVVVHYDSTRNILLSEFPELAGKKVMKIPYYIDIYDRESDVKFDTVNIDASIPTVSVICRQDPRKGINTFLKAVRTLVDKGLRFNCLIAGSGIFINRNKRLAGDLGLGDQVRFLGFVDSVESVLSATDIYVLPSVEEGSGAISLLEAMKKGVAIVTTSCDGIPEDFINGETGILVEPGNANQMANAIETLLKDKDKRRKLGENAMLDYQKRFTFEKMKIGMAGLIGS